MFEAGSTNQGLVRLRAVALAAPGCAEARLALAVALARTGAWREAAVEVEAAATASHRLPAPQTLRVGPVQVGLDTVLNRELRPYLDRVSLSAACRVLEAMGWRASHPADAIGGTGCRAPVDLLAVGTGQAPGVEEILSADGRDVSPHRDGYNVVVIDPRSGAVLGAESFAAWGDPIEGRRLLDLVDALPAGTLVAGAVRGSGSGLLSAPARLALRRLGVAAWAEPGEAHAFLAVKGCGAGTAAESLARDSRALVLALAATPRPWVESAPGPSVQGPGSRAAKATGPNPVLAQYLVEQARLAPAGVAADLAEGPGGLVLSIAVAP
jgi:hypothetical protein